MIDSTGEKDVKYNYDYSGDNVKVDRTDGFIKEKTQTTDETSGNTNISSSYTFKNVKGENEKYTSTSSSK